MYTWLIFAQIWLPCNSFGSLEILDRILKFTDPKNLQTASDPECRCSSCYRSHEVRAYYASSAQSALATCLASDHVQDSSHRVQVSPRSGPTVPHGVLYVDIIRCWPPSPAICLTLTSSSFHARGQVTAPVVSPFMVPSCGILCHMTCTQLTYLWPHSEID